jgi:small conductance mechanosensitive channel
VSFLEGMTSTFASGVAAAFYSVSGGAARHLPGLLGGLAVLVVAWILGRVVFAAVRRVLARRSTQGHVDVVVARVARGIVLGVGVVVALAVAGVDVGSLVTSLGLVGLTLGFALRDVLSNSMAGVMLLMQRPFRIGDTIVVAGTEGVVTDVRVRDTVLSTPDGRLVFVPNITVFNGVVVNLSAKTTRRMEIEVWTPADGDLEAARLVALDAVSSTPGVLEEPVPEALVASVGPDSARIVARGWVDTSSATLEGTGSAALARARALLGSAGIEAHAIVRGTAEAPVEGPTAAADL